MRYPKLKPGRYYHVFTRGNNRENLFREERNYAYFLHLVRYIHQNPQRHGFVDDFRSYSHSSYQALLSSKPTQLRRQDVHTWFGGEDNVEAAHDTVVPTAEVESVVDEGFEQTV